MFFYACFLLSVYVDFEQQFSTRETFSADLMEYMSLLSPTNPDVVIIDACQEIVSLLQNTSIDLCMTDGSAETKPRSETLLH